MAEKSNKRTRKVEPTERPKVLVGVATYPDNFKPVHPWTQECLDSLHPPENGTLDIKLYGDDDLGKSMRENLCDKHNRMRQDIIEGGYSHLLTVEADMVVDPTAPQRLLSMDADVAYALYVARTRPTMWLCFLDVSTPSFPSITIDPYTAVSYWGQRLKSQGAGFGCTLIRRKVLEVVSFRLDLKGNLADDINFARDASAAGFVSVHDMSLTCGHIDGSRVLWPNPDINQLYREELIPEEYRMAGFDNKAGLYEVIKPLTGRDGRLIKGVVAEFNHEDARILLEKGAIKLAASSPIEEDN